MHSLMQSIIASAAQLKSNASQSNLSFEHNRKKCPQLLNQLKRNKCQHRNLCIADELELFYLKIIKLKDGGGADVV